MTGYTIRERIARIKEKITLKVAYLLPSSIVYWASIRLICNATTGKYSNQIVPELTAMDALKRWESTQPEDDRQATI